VLTCIGIALPAAPGFIGNYHYASVVALGLFGVGKDLALAYAILLHFLTLAVIVIMGVFFINVSKLNVGFSLKSAVSSWKSAANSERDLTAEDTESAEKILGRTTKNTK
jgi:hypothetical protein